MLYRLCKVNRYYTWSTQKFEVLIKLEPCIILKLFLKISAILSLNFLLDFIPIKKIVHQNIHLKIHLVFQLGICFDYPLEIF